MADDDKKPDEKVEEPHSAKLRGVERGKEEKPKRDKEELKPSVKLDKKLADLAEKIESLTVVEAAQLAKALQEKFGVAAAPQMVAAPQATTVPGAPAAAGGEQPAEEQTTFNVILTNSGGNKISVIKALREINPQLGLKEAKDIADAPPKEILTGVNRTAADEAKGKLEAAGATVELK